MLRTVRPLAAPIALATILTACSGGDGGDAPAGDGGAGTSSATLVAASVAWDQSELQASPGSFELTVDNQDNGIPHNVRVTGNGIDEATEVTEGPDTQTLTLQLEAGTYDFICAVHSSMTGTITVA